MIYNKDISFMNIYIPNKTSTTFKKQNLQEIALIMERLINDSQHKQNQVNSN